MRITLKDTNFSEIIKSHIRYIIQIGLANFLCAFIPSKKARHKIRKALSPSLKPFLCIEDKKYGKQHLYVPSPYSFSPNPPALYNAKGEKLRVFFARSDYYCGGGEKIYYDMHNIALPEHFYMDKCCLERVGNPTKKYARLAEPPAIEPEINAMFEKQGLGKDFDLVLTHSDKILNALPNARLLPYWSVWYGNEVKNAQKDNVKVDEEIYLFKDKGISMMCSDKLLTPVHYIRHDIAHRALKSGKVDVFGRFNGGQEIPFKSKSLEKYRFSIIVENHISSYYFTEKILDCFASMTIPLYLGATKIDEFFNTDGIIKIDKDVDIDKLIKFCTKEEYESRLEAIKDNFHRLFAYRAKAEENLLNIIDKG